MSQREARPFVQAADRARPGCATARSRRAPVGKDAQVSNDELLVRIADPAAYQAMAAHLLRQWAAASTLAPGM